MRVVFHRTLTRVQQVEMLTQGHRGAPDPTDAVWERVSPNKHPSRPAHANEET